MMRRASSLLVLLVTAGCNQAPQEAPPDAPRPPLTPALARADSLYTAGGFVEARALWEEALAEAWNKGDSATAARLMTSMSLADRNLGRYPESRRIGEAALALKLQLGLARDYFRSYNALGLLAWDEGRLDDAATRFQQASDAANAVADRLGVAKAAANSAQLHRARGEPLLARQGFLMLRDVSREVGDTISLGRALLNLAMVDLLLGDPIAAVASVEEARALALASGDAEVAENALGQMATAYMALGQPQHALAAIDSALIVAETHGLRRRVAEDLKLLGDLYAHAGDHRRALDQYARAQTVNVELGLPEEQGNTLRDEARSLWILGLVDTARARVEGALRIHRAGGFLEAELADHLLLAELAADRGDRSGAVGAINAARRIARGMEAVLPLVEVVIASARVEDKTGRPEAVLEALDQVGAGGFALLGEDQRWEADALRARAHARLGHLEAAELAGRRAITAIERARAGYQSGVLRTTYLTARVTVYADLVLVLLARGQISRAFEVADAARGRALLEHLGTARREVAQGGGAAGDLLRGELLLRRIDELTAKLRDLAREPPNERGASEVAQTRSLEDRLVEVRAEYEALLARTGAVPTGEAVLLGATRMTAAEIQGSLRPDELLVEYLVTPDRVHLFALSRHGLSHSSQPILLAELTSRVRLARELTARPGPQPASEPVLRELHRLLVTPLGEAGPSSGTRRLIVVPHGPLAYLPFAALQDETGASLVARYPILVLPSASALPALRTRSRPGSAGTSLQSVALAPLPRALPATRIEVQHVQRVLGGRTLVGSRATEAAFRAALATAGVVHVATHGVMNQVNPMFTRLELAPGLGKEVENDGHLEVHELLGLRVRADLVYLSGCETAKGPAWHTGFEQGEDYVTLGQAFLYAGAGNVVATLWRVDDRGAAAFASRFFRALATADPVEALAQAQRAMLQDVQYRAPYYWAAYQISGSGAPARLGGGQALAP